MKAETITHHCSICSAEVQGRLRLNRSGEPLCRDCFRKRTQAHELRVSRHRTRRWWRQLFERRLVLAQYVLAAALVLPIVYKMVQFIAAHQVPPAE